MSFPHSYFKFLFATLILLSQAPVFGMENSVASTPQEAISTKGFGLDQRVKIVGAILLIFAPLGLLAYQKNRKGTIGKESKINILERKSLDQHSSIFLVETLGTTLLLSKTSAGISLIKEVTCQETFIAPEERTVPTLKNVCLISNS